MALAKYIATWKEGILWGRDRHSCLCGQLTCKITGLFCIWKGINNKWMTTHIDVHPTMQCALFLSFSPWCFTSPKVIFFFLPCSEALQLQTLPWCLSGKHRKLNYRKKNPKASKKNSLDYSDSTKIHLSAGQVHIKQMCPLAPVIYLGNCELTGIKWPLQGPAAVMSARDRVVRTSRDIMCIWSE